MINLIKACVLISVLAPLGTGKKLNKFQASAIISCLNSKAGEMGSPLLANNRGEFIFHYHFGKFAFQYPNGEAAEVGRDDEVRIGVYGQDEQSVVIYDVFIGGPSTMPVVEIASPATFRRRSGKWIAGDNPNGIAMDLYLRSLLRMFAKQKPDVISIKKTNEIPGANCVVLHP